MVPQHPKIYHIVHIDRLASIIADGCLWCDEIMTRRQDAGPTIGMDEIKRRRLGNPLNSHPGLTVGQCVPFYFCPRSVMLYVIARGNHPGLAYTEGEEPILHMEADLLRTVRWARANGKRWAFTLSNAGAFYFEDRSCLEQLDEIDWNAVNAREWGDPKTKTKEGKQAEFLIEESFPWTLVDRIGVKSSQIADKVRCILAAAAHQPRVEVRREWYYY